MEGFVYHHSPRENRDSISKDGLRLDRDQTGGGAIYFDEDPMPTGPNDDVWAVWRSDLKSLGRDHTDAPVGATWHVAYEDIPPTILKRQ